MVRSVRIALVALFSIAASAAFAQANIDSFNPNANAPVQTLALQADGKVLVGGSFTQIAGAARPGLARLLGTGALDTTFTGPTTMTGVPYSILPMADGKLIVAGNLTMVAGQVRNGIARLNADGTLDAVFNPDATANGGQGNVFRVVLLSSGKFLVGGHFVNIGGSGRSKIARLNSDGTVDTTFNAGAMNVGDYIWSMAEQADGKIVIGGGFSAINGVARDNVARLNADGSLDGAFDIGLRVSSGSASASVVLVQPDGRLLVSGNFDRAKSVGQAWAAATTVANLVRFQTSGAVDTAFVAKSSPVGSTTNAAIHWMLLQPDRRILIGGDFTSVGGAVSSKLARLKASGSPDAYVGPGIIAVNASVWTMAQQADGRLVVGGNFTGIGASTCNRIARYVELAPLNAIASIEAGQFHTCALTNGGAMKCWGSNIAGQLGDGTGTDRLLPVAVVGLGSGVQAISAGASHTCALTSAGGVKCWGNNDNLQLGDGTSQLRRSTPVDVVGLASGVQAISAGSDHTCALLITGAIRCWGDNSKGQLGDGTTTMRGLPTDVIGFGGTATAISAGGQLTCALTSWGAAKCWGANNVGQLGNGTLVGSTSPVPVSGISSGVLAISAGEFHGCAVTSVGAATCWGSNIYGQLGNTSYTNSSTPVSVSDLGSGVTTIGAGTTGSFLSIEHNCALTNAGAVQCWGSNESGELGVGSGQQNSTYPVAVIGLASGVQAIAVGADHNCALMTAGAVRCWGLNAAGQLGDDTTVDRSTPVAVQTLVPVNDLIFADGFN